MDPVQQDILHKMLNESADRNQKAFVTNIPEAERLHALEPDQGPEIPDDVWDHATDIYLEQYGDDGYGGDASMETIRDMALSIMGQPRGRDDIGIMKEGMSKPMAEDYAPPGMNNNQWDVRMGPGSARPRPNEMFDEYGMDNRRRMIPGNTERAKGEQFAQMYRNRDRPPEDAAYSNLNRIGEQAYLKNEGDPLQVILQKMLGGIK